MACPICGRVLCDHSPAERGQTHEEMMADCYDMTVEEYRRKTNPQPESKTQPEKDNKGDTGK